MGVSEFMETQQKIFSQIADSFRDTALPEERVVELSLQLIVWERLSSRGDLPEELCLHQRFADNPAQGAHALSKLGSLDGLVGEAFATANINDLTVAGASGNSLRHAIETLLRLRKTGMLDRPWTVDVFPGFAGRRGPDTLPAELADLMVALAECNQGGSAYLPWDHFAQNAARVSDQGCDALIEVPQRTATPALVSLLTGHSFTISYSDPIRDPGALELGRLRKFDSVIAFPPFGVRYDPRFIMADLWNRFPEKTNSAAVLAINHVLSQAEARCVVAVPNSFLFSSGAEAACRQRLLQHGQVCAVVAIPAVLSTTAISFALLVLDARGGNGSVRFVNGDDDQFRKSIRMRANLTNIPALLNQVQSDEKSSVARSVPLEEIASNDWNLEASRYLLDQNLERLLQRLEEADSVMVGDVAEIVRPLPVLRDGEGLRVCEVGAADIPPYGYITSASRDVVVDGAGAWRNERQFLRPFDVVLVVKGSAGKVGIVPADAPPPGESGWIAGQSSVVLRCHDKGHLDAHSLALQLRGPVGQELLKMITAGATIPLIQVRELQQLRLFASHGQDALRSRAALEEEADIQAQIANLVGKQASVSAGLWQLDGES
jgi:type I restriction enzyme M protein